MYIGWQTYTLEELYFSLYLYFANFAACGPWNISTSLNYMGREIKRQGTFFFKKKTNTITCSSNRPVKLKSSGFTNRNTAVNLNSANFDTESHNVNIYWVTNIYPIRIIFSLHLYFANFAACRPWNISTSLN